MSAATQNPSFCSCFFFAAAQISFLETIPYIALGMGTINHLFFLLFCASPLIGLCWVCGMYQVSWHIFSRQEL